MNNLMTTRELAEKLGTPITWIYERSRKGSIPGMIKLGRYCLFDPKDIDMWIEELKKKNC